MMRGFMSQTQATLRSLETQVSQIALNQNNRASGTLPSNTELPQAPEKEHVKAVTLRSGKELPESMEKESTTKTDFEKTPKSIPIPEIPVIPIPEVQVENQDPKITKKIKILRSQMPSYAKFLGETQTQISADYAAGLLQHEFNINRSTIYFEEGCSALLTNKIPPEQKDPGSFTIPCSIGGKEVGKALCDLGASVNVMPLSIFKSLGIGEARPTTVTLILTDKTIAYPKGKIENVLVQVDKFIFSADFIILDFEADKDIPILLGRPFLATCNTLKFSE
ncbi:hypothetical protein L6452_43235 [Arctium lappa]|uniref:Uncharacterized protein n=1 Tax=Arctium lappa TaxID=4217 RepID=A0ACB8XJU5_ARCLA|nr:hypothetical protein L6452_43235 [Arctium lappa]